MDEQNYLTQRDLYSTTPDAAQTMVGAQNSPRQISETFGRYRIARVLGECVRERVRVADTNHRKDIRVFNRR